jgi:hypothetical protein
MNAIQTRPKELVIRDRETAMAFRRLLERDPRFEKTNEQDVFVEFRTKAGGGLSLSRLLVTAMFPSYQAEKDDGFEKLGMTVTHNLIIPSPRDFDHDPHQLALQSLLFDKAFYAYVGDQRPQDFHIYLAASDQIDRILTNAKLVESAVLHLSAPALSRQVSGLAHMWPLFEVLAGLDAIKPDNPFFEIAQEGAADLRKIRDRAQVVVSCMDPLFQRALDAIADQVSP